MFKHHPLFRFFILTIDAQELASRAITEDLYLLRLIRKSWWKYRSHYILIPELNAC